MSPTRSVASNPIVRYVADALRFYFEFHAALRRLLRRLHPRSPGRRRRARPVARHDRGLFVDVETRGEMTTGMTVATAALTGRAPNLDVAIDADVATSWIGSWNASEGWRRTASTWHARRGGKRGPRGRPLQGLEEDEHVQLGQVRHEDDRPHPDRDRDQHRPGPDRRGGPQDPDLSRFDRDDPRRRAGRSHPRPRHGPAGQPHLDLRPAGAAQSPYAAPFAIVAAEIGFLSGVFGQLGFFRSRPNSSGQHRRWSRASWCGPRRHGYYGFLRSTPARIHLLRRTSKRRCSSALGYVIPIGIVATILASSHCCSSVATSAWPMWSCRGSSPGSSRPHLGPDLGRRLRRRHRVRDRLLVAAFQQRAPTSRPPCSNRACFRPDRQGHHVVRRLPARSSR